MKLENIFLGFEHATLLNPEIIKTSTSVRVKFIIKIKIKY